MTIFWPPGRRSGPSRNRREHETGRHETSRGFHAVPRGPGPRAAMTPPLQDIRTISLDEALARHEFRVFVYALVFVTVTVLLAGGMLLLVTRIRRARPAA